MKQKAIIGIIILSLFLAVYFVGGINARKSVKRLTEAIQTIQEANFTQSMIYEVEIDGFKREVSEQKQIIVTQKEAIKTGLIQKERYKKLYYKEISNVVDMTAQIKVLSDSLKHNAKIVYVDSIEKDSLPCLLLPFQFWEKNEFLDLKGVFDFNGKVHYELSMPVPLDLTIGIKRKSRIPTVSAFSTSPYVTDIQIQSVKVVEDNKWYDSGWVKFSAGVLTGFTIIGLMN